MLSSSRPKPNGLCVLRGAALSPILSRFTLIGDLILYNIVVKAEDLNETLHHISSSFYAPDPYLNPVKSATMLSLFVFTSVPLQFPVSSSRAYFKYIS